MLWDLLLEIQVRLETNGGTLLQKQRVLLPCIEPNWRKQEVGGPAPKAPSSQLETVIAFYQDSASFKGIDCGLETDVLQTGIYIFFF